MEPPKHPAVEPRLTLFVHAPNQMERQRAGRVATARRYMFRPELYDLCDELGVCVFGEIPVWQIHQDTLLNEVDYSKWIDPQFRQTILALRNRPSVLLWAPSNEAREVYDYWDHAAHLPDRGAPRDRRGNPRDHPSRRIAHSPVALRQPHRRRPLDRVIKSAHPTQCVPPTLVAQGHPYSWLPGTHTRGCNNSPARLLANK